MLDLTTTLTLLGLLAGALQTVLVYRQIRQGRRAVNTALTDVGTPNVTELRARVVKGLRKELTQRIGGIDRLLKIRTREATQCGTAQLNERAFIDAPPDAGLILLVGQPGSGRTVLLQRRLLSLSDNFGALGDAISFPSGSSSFEEWEDSLCDEIRRRWKVPRRVVSALLAQRAIHIVVDQADSASDESFAALIRGILKYLTGGGTVYLPVTPERLSGLAPVLRDALARIITIDALPREEVLRAARQMAPGTTTLSLIEAPETNPNIYALLDTPLWLSASIASDTRVDLAEVDASEMRDLLVDQAIQRLAETKAYSPAQATALLTSFFGSGGLRPKTLTNFLFDRMSDWSPYAVLALRLSVSLPLWFVVAKHLSPWAVGLLFGGATFIVQASLGAITAHSRSLREVRRDPSGTWGLVVRLELAGFTSVFAISMAIQEIAGSVGVYPAVLSFTLALESSVYALRVVPAVWAVCIWRGEISIRQMRFLRYCAAPGVGLVVENRRRFEIRHQEIADVLRRRERLLQGPGSSREFLG